MQNANKKQEEDDRDSGTMNTGKHAEAPATDNDHQKTVQGKNQKGPADKVGRDAGGNEGSKGQNSRSGGSGQEGANSSVGSHKPGGDGLGTKKFKHESDDVKRNRSRS